jgi:DNA repair protein RadA/Sms
VVKFVCNQCGAEFPKWMGKCTSCNAWNSLEEVEVLSSAKHGKGGKVNTRDYQSLDKLEHVGEEERISTGYEEFNRVLGGGIVRGEVILLSGDPGIGKSTLLLQSVIKLAMQGLKILYVSGEESQMQVALRASRLAPKDASLKNIIIASLNAIEDVVVLAEQEKPNLVIVDSIQTVESNNITGVSGGVAQVKECTTIISRYAKSVDVPVILVGHVTKEGYIAGPKILEHLVDAVIYLEGDSFREFRILRSVKNRYGAQGEIGVFEMNDKGLDEVANPSSLFINPLTATSAGVCLATVIEGLRPIILEVQALTSATYPGTARRVASGFDYNRLQLLSAVISKTLNYKLQNFDIYTNIVGGLKISDPSVDLGLCAAIISSYTNKVIGQDTVFIGEVGLSGEVRVSVNMQKRLDEIEKLGISTAVVSSLYKPLKKSKKINIVGISNVANMLSTFS